MNRAPWVHPMQRGEPPRWFDGRLRRIVAKHGTGPARSEVLECGHAYVPDGKAGGHNRDCVRVCWECEAGT